MSGYYIHRAQHGEDRILVRLFHEIGTENRVAVEFGAKDGVFHSNTARFRQKGWRVLQFDRVPEANDVTQATITPRNINTIFAKKRVPHDLDLLSIDIDGNDFWVWEALTFQPRVVIIEYNAGFPADVSVTVPYDETRQWDGTNYYGASARALARLGGRKGYCLHAYTRSNLVFVRKELVDEYVRLSQMSLPGRMKRRDPKARPWVEYA